MLHRKEQGCYYNKHCVLSMTIPRSISGLISTSKDNFKKYGNRQIENNVKLKNLSLTDLVENNDTTLEVPITLITPCSESQSESLPSHLDQIHLAQHKQPWYGRINPGNNTPTSSSDYLGREFRSDSQRRWSYATQKIKSLLAVSDALNMNRNSRTRERAMSIEQKSHFLDKFSTRDRRVSGTSFDIRRKHDQIQQADGVSNISSLELKEVLQEMRDSKTNMSNFGEYFYNEQKNCSLFQILFEPYSRFIYFWSWIVIMAIHYNSWVIILRIAFPAAQHNFSVMWYAFDYTADLIYFIDILISSRMSFLENGIYVDSIKRVTVKYFRSTSFILDLLSLSPLDLLYLVIGTNPALRVPRLVKFFKVFQGKKLIESMTNFPNLVRGVFWLHIMFLLMHWNCSFYYIISEYEGFGFNHWVYPKIAGIHTQLMHRYMKCMYWSTLVLTTIGENSPPETTIECVYMVICYITGIFIFATIVGQAGNVIQNMNASRMEFERQRDNTMQYMKVHNVPTNLQKRVRLWYDYTYSRGRFNGGDDINQVTMLPDKMKTELALHVHLETLRKVSFLQKCQPEFLHDLVLKMKLHIFTPGDFVIRKGEIAREMYVISDGMAEVVSDSGRVLKVLRAGDFFGEIGLLSLSAGQNRRTADVRSCGYIELFVLSKEDVMSSIRDYPDAQRILAKHGKKRLVLGSKAYGSGPRDETTSGSQSDSEIELKITRADSDVSEHLSLYAKEVNTPNAISVDEIEEISTRHNTQYIPETESISKCIISPRNSVFLDMERSNPKIQLDKCSSVGSHGKVIGPATSLKSLDSRLSSCKNILSQTYLKQEQCKSPPTTIIVSDDIETKSLCDTFLKPRSKNMRRTNSYMQRRPKRLSMRKRRDVYSDGENKSFDCQSHKMSSQSSISQRSNGTIIHKNFNDMKYKRLDEELFLHSMKKLYLDTIHSIKKRSQTQMKELKSKLLAMERNYSELYYEKERVMNEREAELKEELFSTESQLYRLGLQLQQKEEELRMKEEMWKQSQDNRKRQTEDNGRRYDFTAVKY